MQTTSRIVETNQRGPHKNLEATVRKHLEHPSRKPIAAHTQQAFEKIQHKLRAAARPIIFDSCCGVGDSSRALARQFPDHWVIGVDKSAHRLSRERAEVDTENLILVRADLNDLYRLADDEGWRLARHYILYPNPWPKSVHLGRRWHGAPVFPSIIALGGRLELRSNWLLYLREFQIALKVVGLDGVLEPFEPEEYLTPFEKKYHESGQTLWRLVTKL